MKLSNITMNPASNVAANPVSDITVLNKLKDAHIDTYAAFYEAEELRLAAKYAVDSADGNPSEEVHLNAYSAYAASDKAWDAYIDAREAYNEYVAAHPFVKIASEEEAYKNARAAYAAADKARIAAYRVYCAEQDDKASTTEQDDKSRATYDAAIVVANKARSAYNAASAAKRSIYYAV